MPQRYIKIFHSWPEETRELSLEEQGSLINALVAHARGDPVQYVGNERFLFPVFQSQIDRDAESYNTTVARNRANGQKGGRPRKNPENPVGFEKPKLTQKSQDKDKDKEYTPLPPKGEDDGFSGFWKVYPRKAAKKCALNAWNRLHPDEALTARIIQSVERFRLDPQWSKENGQFVPYPATFLNGRRWEDEPSGKESVHDEVDIKHLYED